MNGSATTFRALKREAETQNRIQQRLRAAEQRRALEAAAQEPCPGCGKVHPRFVSLAEVLRMQGVEINGEGSAGLKDEGNGNGTLQ